MIFLPFQFDEMEIEDQDWQVENKKYEADKEDDAAAEKRRETLGEVTIFL